MSETILHTDIEGKDVTIHLSGRAEKRIRELKEPLFVNMELYFSCFIKKMVNFSGNHPRTVNPSKVFENFSISFRPVQSESCNIHELKGDNGPNLIDLPAIKRKAIVPGHLFIDVKKGNWKGDFTWHLSGKKRIPSSSESLKL